MAPEQAAGAVTPAVDQYSFCASLGEALREGGHAPPRWLAELLERGRAADPRARFGSMGELLRALGRDPARVWRWRVGAAAVAIATGAAFLIGRGRIGAELEPCSGGARELAAAWSPDAQRAELTRVARFGGYGVEVAARLEARLVDHGARWVAHHREACLAHRRGEQSAALLDRRMVCLARSRAALAAVAEVAATTAGVGALPDLARAAAALPDPAACADPAALTADSEPPPPVLAPRLAVLRGALEGARVQLAAGRARVAGDVARSVASEASGLGYAPLLAEARLIEGTAAMRSAPDRASAALAEAVAAGLAHRADAIAVEAWARRAWSAWIEGRRGDPVAALAGLDVMDALAARTPTARFARALLHNNAGSLALARGRRDEARAALERAQRAAVGVTGPGAVELVAIRRNLALVIDDPVARDRVAAAAELDLARLLGADHPDTLLTRYLRAGASVVRAEAARAMLEATCERFALHERLEPLRAPCEVELADLRDLLGDRAGAAAAYARAMRAPDPETLEAAGHVARLRGDPAGALAALESALRTLAASDAPGQWYVRAKLYLAQGLALREAGRLAEAAVALDRALVAAASVAPGAPLAQERRVARARAELAEVLAASRSQPARARELARAAASWYRAAGIAAPRLDELAAEPAGPP
jgi:tetratricopeptide (TPR) repeat protein